MVKIIKRTIPQVGEPKPLNPVQVNALAARQERSVCPACGGAYFYEAKEMHVIPATHPENPRPGIELPVMLNRRSFCSACHEPIIPDKAVLESRFEKKEDA